MSCTMKERRKRYDRETLYKMNKSGCPNANENNGAGGGFYSLLS
jgi:hypothetical protein